ncbi:MAG: hypothetical protein BZY88_15060, partial [SAR202 cluster bacterium Io17-Chloro-G9]
RTLSNGMQKRASIARALLHQPRILLMDEPESGLDSESLAMLKSLVADWTALGRAVVMTTHNTQLAGSITAVVDSPRIGQMVHGKVRFQNNDRENAGDNGGNGLAGQEIEQEGEPSPSPAPPESSGTRR